MASARPLMQLGIGDLEEIFDKQGKNPAALARLKHELSHRQVPRAVALLEKIQRAEARLEELDIPKREAKTTRGTLQLKPKATESAKGAAPSNSHTEVQASVGQPAPPAQQDLLASLDAILSGNVPSGAGTVSSSSQVTPVKTPEKAIQEAVIPQLALEDACRILKVALGDSWERVEAARRKIVLRTSPLAVRGMSSEQIQKLLANARMANDAAIVIAARRSGRP